MTVRPILFSGPMVCALLDGRKFQTRRVLKPQPHARVTGFEKVFMSPPFFEARDGLGKPVADAFPYRKHCVSPWPKISYAPGNLLYVREEHYRFGYWQEIPGAKTKAGRSKWRFEATSAAVLFEPPAEFRKGRHHQDTDTPAWHRRPGMFHHRWASRLTLRVTEVRVQRLQEISEEDAKAEGAFPDCDHCGTPSPCECDLPIPEYRRAFMRLWDSLNAKRSYGWDMNPWVVAVSFEVIAENADAVIAGKAPTR